MCVEPVQGTALLRLCEQLMLEPELTLQKAIFISSQIVTAMEEAKIIAQEAVDHVQAVHSLTEEIHCTQNPGYSKRGSVHFC